MVISCLPVCDLKLLNASVVRNFDKKCVSSVLTKEVCKVKYLVTELVNIIDIFSDDHKDFLCILLCQHCCQTNDILYICFISLL